MVETKSIPWLFTSESAKIARAKRRVNHRQATSDNPPEHHQLDSWTERRLTRTRGQLKALDRALELALDANDSRGIERIASSISRLSEIERKLAGRPDPGAKRPGREKGRPTSPLAGLAAPTPADPAPSPEPISPSHSEPLSQPDANSQNAA